MSFRVVRSAEEGMPCVARQLKDLVHGHYEQSEESASGLLLALSTVGCETCSAS